MLKKMIMGIVISTAILLTSIPAFAACSSTNTGASTSPTAASIVSCSTANSSCKDLLSKIMSKLNIKCKSGKAGILKCKALKGCKTSNCIYKQINCSK